MKKSIPCGVLGVVFIFFIFQTGQTDAENISCYQCIRDSFEECSEDQLSPCAAISDRCVIHYTKDATNGLTIKRECGLAPCVFNDAMVDRGLGLDRCDRTRDEYSCITCCKGSGCNKNSSEMIASKVLILVVIVMMAFLNAINSYQPPYRSETD